MSDQENLNHEDEDLIEFAIEGDADADDVEVKVVDDAPKEDQGKELLPQDKEEGDEPTPEEMASYSEKVQKRIKDATFRFHDQRRKKEQAERERDEALRFAQAQLERAQQYESAVYQYEAGFVDQAKNRVDVELAQAQAELKAAFEVGDPDKMADAQAKIAKLAVAQDQYGRFQPREVQPQQYQPVHQPQVQPRDDDAERFIQWREKNPWFDQDEQLQAFAMGVHTKIVGSNPEAVGSDEYYREVERQVKAAFPQKFAQGNTQERNPRTSPVAGVSRTSGDVKARKTITLTAAQMTLCRRLGITPQDYVKQLAKTGE